MSTPTTLSGLILAAGQGNRLGGVAKGAMRLDGEPVLRRQVHALLEVGITDIVVVLGAHAETLGPLISDLPVHTVRHASAVSELTASQRLGLAALRPGASGVMVILSDQVLLDAHDLREAAQQWAQRAPAVQCLYPVVAGQRGHPTVLSPVAVEAILTQPEALGVRDWQRASQHQVMSFLSGNAHFITDVDTLSDLAQVNQILGGERLQRPA